MRSGVPAVAVAAAVPAGRHDDSRGRLVNEACSVAAVFAAAHVRALKAGTEEVRHAFVEARVGRDSCGYYHTETRAPRDQRARMVSRGGGNELHWVGKIAQARLRADHCQNLKVVSCCGGVDSCYDPPLPVCPFDGASVEGK